jgi:hypothetical protein
MLTAATTIFALATLAGLIRALAARSPWLRRPAVALLVTASALGSAIIAVLLVKAIVLLVAHGLGFSWSWSRGGGDDSDSQTEGKAERSGAGDHHGRPPNWLRRIGLGRNSASRLGPRTCLGCGRAISAGTDDTCISCRL